MTLLLRNVSCKPLSALADTTYTPLHSFLWVCESIGNNNLQHFQSSFDGAVFTVWCNFLNFLKLIAFDSVFWTFVCKISLMRWLSFFQSLHSWWSQVTYPRTFVEIRCFIDFLLINYLPQRFRYRGGNNCCCLHFSAHFFELFRSSQILSHLPLMSTLSTPLFWLAVF